MEVAESDRTRLIDACLDVQKNAFAPYSNFFVGAAILTANGNRFVGCNVENASYGLAICAERGAISAMVAAGEKTPIAIAIASRGGVTPCGACRQVLSEFGLNYAVLLVDSDQQKPVAQWTVGDLLPGAFRLDS